MSAHHEMTQHSSPVRSHRASWVRRAALASGVALVLAGCSAPGSDNDSDSTNEQDLPVEELIDNSRLNEGMENLEAYYDQELNWVSCDEVDLDTSTEAAPQTGPRSLDEFECASLAVPVDYDAPEDFALDIALTRLKDTEALPSVLYNPGGPGSSGIDLVHQALDFITTDELRSGYSVVGFDPRGVGASTALECLDDAELDEARQVHADLSTEDGRELAASGDQEFIKACLANSGELTRHLSTEETAKDLDIIRAVLDEESLHYLGVSYGTKLGATYADLFPENVGRFVLDSVLHPEATEHDIVLAQAEGFEKALDTWAQWCSETEGCQVGSDEASSGQRLSPDEVKAEVQDVLAEVAASPLPSDDGREVPVSEFISGLIVPFYSAGEGSWPFVDRIISDAQENDGTTALYFADLMAGRNDQGHYDPDETTPFIGINCADYVGQFEADTEGEDEDGQLALLEERAAELADVAPTFGPYFSYGELGCTQWPAEPTAHDGDYSAAGAENIVVIGTTLDPATPFPWAEQLARDLDSAVLVTNVGEGHGAYDSENQCIAEIVDDYFLNGEVPADGVECR